VLLVLVAFVAVPWMLVPKPMILKKRHEAQAHVSGPPRPTPAAAASHQPACSNARRCLLPAPDDPRRPAARSPPARRRPPAAQSEEYGRLTASEDVEEHSGHAGQRRTPAPAAGHGGGHGHGDHFDFGEVRGAGAGAALWGGGAAVKSRALGGLAAAALADKLLGRPQIRCCTGARRLPPSPTTTTTPTRPATRRRLWCTR
jgi:hypothetical protein